MELGEVINYIKTLSAEDKTIIKAALKAPPTRDRAMDVCTEDVRRLLDALPHTTDEHKNYRYNATAAHYVQSVKELTDVITHNFQCKHNLRGYPTWMGADTTNRPAEYKHVFHEITETILRLMAELQTEYTHKS